MDERENDENASMWTAEARLEYELWCREQDERDLPPHKRTGYAERMYEAADFARKEQRENALK